VKSAPALLSLLTALACPAAEIVAWRVPVESFLNRPLPKEEMTRLSSPPEKSPFFREGDELWDLKRLPVEMTARPKGTAFEPGYIDDLERGRLETAPPLEWVVWNATTSRLITKSEWNGVSQLHLRFAPDRQPTLCKFTVDLFEVPPDGSPPKPDSIPAQTLTWLTKPGITSAALVREDSGMISCKAEPTVGPGSRSILLNLQAKCALKDQLPMDLEARFIIQSGDATWVARDFMNGKGMDLRLQATLVLLDGTPVDESMLIQRENNVSPLAFDSIGVSVSQVRDGRWLATCEQTSEYLMDIFTPQVPLAEQEESTSGSSPEKNTIFPTAFMAGRLGAWFTDPVWNMSGEFNKMGLNLSETDLAGYAPLERRVFLLSDKSEEIDKFGSIWGGGCHLPHQRIAVSTGNPPQSRIICNAGTKASLRRLASDGKVIRHVEFEPTIGNSGNQVDLDMYIRNGPEEMPDLEVRTSTTLDIGHPQLLFSAAGENRLPISVEAEMISPWSPPADAIIPPQAKLPDE